MKSKEAKKSVKKSRNESLEDLTTSDWLDTSDDNRLDGFVDTRTTLLRRVNAGDAESFTEFYNIYCPILLRYLGLRSYEQKENFGDWRWDIVQTVFAKFYKAFALTEDPETGEKRVPRNIFSVFGELVNKKTGMPYKIKFRYYLITCLKNAVRTKWRAETKKGTVNIDSLDKKVDSEEDTTLKELIPDPGADPVAIDLAKEQGERLAAVRDIWFAVIKAILLDESLEEMNRDIIYKSLAEGVKADKLSAKWGIEKNYVFVIKSRGKTMAEKITRAILEMLEEEDVKIDEEAERLYKAVASMKPGKIKRADKFMIGLAKELLADRK